MTKFEESVNVMRAAFLKDKNKKGGMWDVYKSTIAMAFFDEAREQDIRISQEKLHKISTKAAENFLNLFCSK